MAALLDYYDASSMNPQLNCRVFSELEPTYIEKQEAVDLSTLFSVFILSKILCMKHETWVWYDCFSLLIYYNIMIIIRNYE